MSCDILGMGFQPQVAGAKAAALQAAQTAMIINDYPATVGGQRATLAITNERGQPLAVPDDMSHSYLLGTLHPDRQWIIRSRFQSVTRYDFQSIPRSENISPHLTVTLAPPKSLQLSIASFRGVWGRLGPHEWRVSGRKALSSPNAINQHLPNKA